MADEDLAIINDALILIGARSLSSLSDDSKSARIAALLLDSSRDEMLVFPVGRGEEREGWSFAVTRVELTEHDESPAFGYENQFELPSDFLGPVAIVDEGGDALEYPLTIESFVEDGGDEIRVHLTDETTVFMKYTRQITNYAVFPAWFRRLIAVHIARKMSVPIRQAKTSTKEDRLTLLFEEVYAAAVAANQIWGSRINDEGRNVDDGNSDVADAAQRGESRLGTRIIER